MNKSILVTGASSGIGWATSLELAEKGWRVFAAVRKEADAKKLRDASSGKITTVIMDIVDYESVKRGAKEIEKADDDHKAGIFKQRDNGIHQSRDHHLQCLRKNNQALCFPVTQRQ